MFFGLVNLSRGLNVKVYNRKTRILLILREALRKKKKKTLKYLRWKEKL